MQGWSQKTLGVVYLLIIACLIMSVVSVKPVAADSLESAPYLQSLSATVPVSYVEERQIKTEELSAFIEQQSDLRFGTQYLDFRVNAEGLNVRHYQIDTGENLNKFDSKVFADWVINSTKSLRVGEEFALIRSQEDNFLLNKETGQLISCPFLREGRPQSVLKAVSVGELLNPRYFVFMFQPETSLLRIYPFASRAESIEARDFGQAVVTRYVEINFLEQISEKSANTEYYRRAAKYFQLVNSFRIKEDQENPQSAFLLTFWSMCRDVKVSVLADWPKSVMYADVNFGVTADLYRDYHNDQFDRTQQQFNPHGDYTLPGNEHLGTIEISQSGFRFGLMK
ncbi:hypothetical protein HN958_03775 [Candidatus Falkowbacteria bacterium]|jgi:hypothetical protein|nr:hypothetical protein [Candidatus Falkowbacteria bacterium]MBT7007597.1 hypothetical protein [Candidatus Falkowbacteria bacterium]